MTTTIPEGATHIGYISNQYKFYRCIGRVWGCWMSSTNKWVSLAKTPIVDVHSLGYIIAAAPNDATHFKYDGTDNVLYYKKTDDEYCLFLAKNGWSNALAAKEDRLIALSEDVALSNTPEVVKAGKPTPPDINKPASATHWVPNVDGRGNPAWYKLNEYGWLCWDNGAEEWNYESPDMEYLLVIPPAAPTPPAPPAYEPPRSKYHREIKPGVWVDVYDVLAAFDPDNRNAADDHAIKKMLLPGKRGVKDGIKDRREAIQSLNRSLELEKRDED